MNCTVDVDELAEFLFALMGSGMVDLPFLFGKFFAALDLDTATIVNERFFDIMNQAERD